MPMMGRPNSSVVVPVARHSARAPVFIAPTVTLSDLSFMRGFLWVALGWGSGGAIGAHAYGAQAIASISTKAPGIAKADVTVERAGAWLPNASA
jgi:hypothetical protein